MTKQKPKVKRIRTEQDIDNLKRKDVVEIEEYGLMRYDGKLYGDMVFLGRFNQEGYNAIIEVGFGRDQLYPSNRGRIGDKAKECWEHYYWDGEDAINNSKNKKLLEVGL